MLMVVTTHTDPFLTLLETVLGSGGGRLPVVSGRNLYLHYIIVYLVH